jgi:hypothetical protein
MSQRRCSHSPCIWSRRHRTADGETWLACNRAARSCRLRSTLTHRSIIASGWPAKPCRVSALSWPATAAGRAQARTDSPAWRAARTAAEAAHRHRSLGAAVRAPQYRSCNARQDRRRPRPSRSRAKRPRSLQSRRSATRSLRASGDVTASPMAEPRSGLRTSSSTAVKASVELEPGHSRQPAWTALPHSPRATGTR